MKKGFEITAELIAYLQEALQEPLGHMAPLAGMTSYRIGGPAEVLAYPRDVQELSQLLKRAHGEKIPVTILGGGSNVLVRDGGVPGLVVNLRKGFQDFEVHPLGESIDVLDADGFSDDPYETSSVQGSRAYPKGAEVYVGAGYPLPKLVKFCNANGLVGLVPCAGVPGTVGGAVRMNAGTAKEFIGDSITAVDVVRLSGRARRLEGDKLNFGYRDSRLGKDELITGIRLSLKPGDPAALQKATVKAITRRRETQPLTMPNAGSIFKNPPGESAGKLIEHAGVKGVRVRGAQISEVHANFIVNVGGATARDVQALIKMIREKVKEDSKVTLELEVKIIGVEPTEVVPDPVPQEEVHG